MSPNDPPLPDANLGQPADELQALALTASPQFLLGVRNKIDRRRTTGQFVTYSWSLPHYILAEMLGWFQLIQDIFGQPRGPQR